MYNVNLIIDSREKYVVEKMDQGLYSTAQLDIGDFQFFVNDQIKIVIERKTVEDYLASVKDSRYKEQKYRAVSYCNENKCIYFYILEGNFTFCDKDTNNKILTSCIINSLIRDKIQFVIVKDLQETINFLNCLKNRLETNPEISDGMIWDNSDYIKSLNIKSKKKENINKQNCLIMQLGVIPGISMTKAKLIVDHHNIESMNQLCDLMSKTRTKEFFKGIKGIGKVSQNTIYTFCGIDQII